MCGVAGVYDPSRRADEPTAVAMREALAHRGPDDKGLYRDPSGLVAIGHRRLSIVDLSPSGRQPMQNERGDVWVACNGEIYNYPELRRDLEARGHRFCSDSDTEVLVHLYEDLGPDLVERLNGMFAFALWDETRQRLVLARDRYGVKPLYLAHDGQRLLFASEVKGLLAALPRRPSVDAEALMEYFTFQNIISDRTLFDGVRLLPPGHIIVAEHGRARERQYWAFRFDGEETLPFEDCVAGVRERFEGAVSRQLMSDVPVGSYLSGGMDSGSICAVASRQIPQLTTITGGFSLAGATEEERSCDERIHSERLATTFDTEHYEIVIQPSGLARALPSVVWHLEDLRVSSSYHNYYVARLASRFVKVVLAGAGGDELFGGYPWRYAVLDDSTTGSEFEGRYFQYWSRLLAPEERRGFFTELFRRGAGDFDPRDPFLALTRRYDAPDMIDRALTFEARVYLHGLFILEDKLSMAHGLESRVPFIDDDLVEFAQRIPSRHKVGNGTGKRVLRAAMRGLIPDATLDLPKQGFVPPEETWYRTSILPYIRETILNSRALSRGYFEPAAVRRVVDEHIARKRNHKLLLWSLMCFEWWNRLFVDGDEPGDYASFDHRPGAAETETQE
ncbi:MAG: asparagine synthase (glutamine-hydrolyzing) [Dehalococcoidia bacterium]|nr:asparagine synthase (glutamine-hydrolyzing) [Dehalococcoidia bacterium]